MAKVVLAFHSFNKRGGIERVAVETATFLAGRGHEVAVVAAQVDDGCLPPSVTVELVPGTGPGPIGAMRFQRAATKAVRTRHADAALGTFGAFGPPGGLVWLGSVHARWLEVSRSYRIGKDRWRQAVNPFHWAALRAERRMYGQRRYRHLLALTEDMRNDLTRFYGVPEADVTILPNGYNPEEFNPERAARERGPARAELGLRDDDIAILFVANEIERKGLPVLIEAVAGLGDARLVVVAVGRLDAAAVRALTLRLGLDADRLCMTGPTPDVGRLLAAGDLFVLPTTYEAWGLVIVEALASGLPVVTSRSAGASVVLGDIAGILLDSPRDAAELAQAITRALSLKVEEPAIRLDELTWMTIGQRYARLLLPGED